MTKCKYCIIPNKELTTKDYFEKNDFMATICERKNIRI